VRRRKADVLHALKHLQQIGQIEQTTNGWRRRQIPYENAQFPVPPLRDGNSGTPTPANTP
jgi:hypothetical protein